MLNHAIPPYGDRLMELVVDPQEADRLSAASLRWPSWELTPRQLCDLELLLNGGFSPLAGFMGRADFESVCTDMRLADGTLWPIPITLDVTPDLAHRLQRGQPLGLRDPEGVLLSALHVEDVWEIDRRAKAQAVYGTLDEKHPGVAHLFRRMNGIGVGGRLEGLSLPVHHDYRPLRLTSSELPPHFNLLFFGHFAELPRERFLAEIARSMKNDGTVYEVMAKDLYGLGYYLSHYKYRYLRLAYLFFLAGFVLASVEQLIRHLL